MHIMLIWNSHTDLDIHVNTPDGLEIFYRFPVGNQCYLLLDENAARPYKPREVKDAPVEDFYLLKGCPTGEYVLNVHNFEQRNGNHTPFAVHLVEFQEGRRVMRGTFDMDPKDTGEFGIVHKETFRVATITKTLCDGVAKFDVSMTTAKPTPKKVSPADVAGPQPDVDSQDSASQGFHTPRARSGTCETPPAPLHRGRDPHADLQDFSADYSPSIASVRMPPSRLEGKFEAQAGDEAAPHQNPAPDAAAAEAAAAVAAAAAPEGDAPAPLPDSTVPHQNPALWGITLEQLLEVADLANTAFKGRKTAANMHDVVATIVKPVCLAHKVSYALYKNPHGLRAQTFVTHCWAEPFLDFVHSIELSLSTFLVKPTLFICSFALPQMDGSTIQNTIGESLHMAPFSRAIAQADHFLVVRNTIADIYTRIWCVAELWMANLSGKWPNFTQVAGENTFSNNTGSCTDAQASRTADKVMVLEALMQGSSLVEKSKRIEEIDAFIQQARAHPGDAGVKQTATKRGASRLCALM